jgi:hypothetical protein
VRRAWTLKLLGRTKEIGVDLVAEKLHVATNATMNTPAVEQRRSPDYLRRLVVSETEKWAKVIKFAGIKPE